MAAIVTWENLRFSTLVGATTKPDGTINIGFSPAFPNVCYGVAVSLDVSGGPRSWCLGIFSLTNVGFTAAIADASSGNPVGGQVLGVQYIAFGDA
jgi:hypothetical protein